AGLVRVRALGPSDLVAQASEVLRHQRVRAIKIGALGTAANVRAIAGLLRLHRDVPVVLDTPMLPTRGRARLLAVDALSALGQALLPRATLVTANVAEAQALLGEDVRTVSEAHDAARALRRTGARAVLVKGGHMEGPSAIDVLAIGDEVIELRARRLVLPPLHGTGCTFASLIAGSLAGRNDALLDDEAIVAAIRWAKRVHHAVLARSVDVGDGGRVLVFSQPQPAVTARWKARDAVSARGERGHAGRPGTSHPRRPPR
ncbi:MAG: hydroxymethylpyrimidine/phosphomethylpyrimidine kinase, partial [Myxococcota bacterium]|nr:hydroxymethylpyrimidine/phosphomethylpyrimidine kinase [Myxococcota bacterium]